MAICNWINTQLFKNTYDTYYVYLALKTATRGSTVALGELCLGVSQLYSHLFWRLNVCVRQDFDSCYVTTVKNHMLQNG